MKLRYRLYWKWIRLCEICKFIYRTPRVWKARRELRRSGYIVRRMKVWGSPAHGGIPRPKAYFLCRASDGKPVIECNRYGIPIGYTIFMGSKAAQRGYPRSKLIE